VSIDVALVRKLIATQFPQWANLPIRPVAFGGWDNRTFHLGDEMTVRLPSAEGYAAQVAKEQRWLPWLAPQLPLPIPAPLAMGVPSEAYPWHWSVYRWIEGEHATHDRITDLAAFAAALGQFLHALQQVDATGGPPAGEQSFYRGGSLTVYDAETRRALALLDGKIDTVLAHEIWETALRTEWQGPPAWVHGDVAAGNLLVKDGRLHAVIDFGCSAIGDPACDLVIAWTFLSGESRAAFRSALPLDDGTWARGRGWALWKALIVVSGIAQTTPLETSKAQRTIDELLAEHLRS
jgi:aminoglycoside phosphotransferase (APT) family kinase protein